MPSSTTTTPGTAVPGLLSEPNAQSLYAIAQRKARYGRRDWFFWRDRQGRTFAAPVSAASAKAAMLATGTRGRFTRFSANDAVPHVWGWRLGMRTIAQCRAGWR